MEKQSRIYSVQQIERIITPFIYAQMKGLIKTKTIDNPYVEKAFTGNGENITEKWNVTFFKYSHSKRGISVVCNDWEAFDAIISQNWEYFSPNDLPVISIDDAGWGFPLCGVMVGASDGNMVKTCIVPVNYFQGNRFSQKSYLKAYALAGMKLITKEGFDVLPTTHQIEICTGYINSELKNFLRKCGFHVRVVEIKGLLQDRLETKFKEYVKETLGSDIYYDPKDMDVDAIPMEYKRCLEFGKKHFPHLLKSGWKSMQKESE